MYYSMNIGGLYRVIIRKLQIIDYQYIKQIVTYA